MKLSVLALLVIAFAAPSRTLSAASRSAATDYVVVIDQTDSVSASERSAWAAIADDVLRRVALGDSILILPVHDRTLDAAPLFWARVPEQGVSIEDIVRAKRRLKEVRETARQTIHQALESRKPARGTELLAIVDRVAASRAGAGKRQTRVYIFSDMLHSMPPINLERTALSASDVPRWVSNAGSRARWHGGLLAGVKVLCVLNGIDSGRRQDVNDRRILGNCGLPVSVPTARRAGRCGTRGAHRGRA
jgi:hypothetical protein